VKNAHIAVALGAALLAQTALLRMITSGPPPVDLVLVVVVFTGLARGPVAALWTGTAAGLLQDVLSGGIVGVSGLAKCLTGVLAGLSGTRFIVSAVASRFLVYVAASLLHAVCYFGVYLLIDTGAPAARGGFLLTQAVVNGLVGVVAVWFVGLAPRAFRRRRQAGTPVSDRRWVLH
jgi:rod shape-determining protein MreD